MKVSMTLLSITCRYIHLTCAWPGYSEKPRFTTLVCSIYRRWCSSWGSALEALNRASVEENIRLLIVLNDNGYAISPGFGAIHDYLQDRHIGDVNPDTLFESLGYEVVGPIDGHSTSQILDLRSDKAKFQCMPTMLKPKKVRA